VLDQHSVMRYTDTPVLTAASRSDPEAPVAMSWLVEPSLIVPANQAPAKAD
jgi:hypothetical protein